jgi:antitoxin (DNA-binding transcriptional repressor) of toxin-antitoxin stability system
MPKTVTINVADAKRHFADLLGRVASDFKVTRFV